MWRRLCGGCVAARALVIAAFLAPAAAARAQEYRVIDLLPEGFNGFLSIVHASHGQAIGGLTPAGGPQLERAGYWSLTGPRFVDLNGDLVTSSGRGIGGGQQAGAAWTILPTGNAYHPVTWAGSAASRTDLLPAGAVSGQVNATDGFHQAGVIQNPANRAALWSGTAASFMDLTPAGFSNANVLGLRGDRQVGYAYNTNSIGQSIGSHAMLWSGTAASAIELHPAGYAYSSADDVVGDQQVGEASFVSLIGQQHAFLWRGSNLDYVDLHLTGYRSSSARGTDGTFQVGVATDAAGVSHAIRWAGTAQSALDLGQFLPSDFKSAFAGAIDEEGNIFGGATDSNGLRHVVAWVPVPEPSTFVLLTSAAAALLLLLARGPRRAA